MDYANPTALRLGLQGVLDGRRHVVLGRVVLGMELEGETYCWNEFYLSDDSGRVATLVFEETEKGPTWKLFQMFVPVRPLSVAEAAAKRVGDTVNLDGAPVRITLVDQSRVYQVEGEAPEGVEPGDVADYFNAEAPNRTLVVSWTGPEIEFFKGRDLPAGQVEAAFNLPRPAPAGASGFNAGGLGDWFSGQTLRVVIIAVTGVCWVAARSCSEEDSPLPPAEPPAKRAAAAMRLPAGAQGRLAAHTYVVAGHALVEVARAGQKFDRHEYALVDEDGRRALLVNGPVGDPAGWHLLTPLVCPPGFSPYDAAALRQGRPAVLAGRPVQVAQLFQTRLLAQDGAVAPEDWPATMQYGLLARAEDDWVLARWTETSLQLYGGRAVPAADVQAALGSGRSADR